MSSGLDLRETLMTIVAALDAEHQALDDLVGLAVEQGDWQTLAWARHVVRRDRQEWRPVERRIVENQVALTPAQSRFVAGMGVLSSYGDEWQDWRYGDLVAYLVANVLSRHGIQAAGLAKAITDRLVDTATIRFNPAALEALGVRLSDFATRRAGLSTVSMPAIDRVDMSMMRRPPRTQEGVA